MIITIIENLKVDREYIEKEIQNFSKLGHKLEYYDEKAKNNDELYERLKNTDIAIIANSVFPDEVLEKLNNLKYISIAFTGYDHINVKLAKQKNIKLSNSRSYSDICVSELVIGQVINIYRKLSEFNIYMGKEIYGKKVLIVGYGNIGKRVYELFEAFGAKLKYYDKNYSDSCDLKEALKEADIVSLHIPSNEETKNMFDYSLLSLMKENSIIVNCARGQVLNLEDLTRVIKEKNIYAALDVFDVEPPLDKDHIVMDNKNIFKTAHIAYLTEESMIRRFNICIENVKKFLQNEHVNSI